MTKKETHHKEQEEIKETINENNLLIHAAAVSDFKVGTEFNGKISSDKNIKLNLVPNIKIIDQVKKLNKMIDEFYNMHNLKKPSPDNKTLSIMPKENKITKKPNIKSKKSIVYYNFIYVKILA